MESEQKPTINFTIIAHVDHGKSTLADSILMHCGNVTKREYKEQILDNMDLERERGITIKAQTVRLEWKGYILNLIDTPGHSDFQYEVSRSLKACEVSLLLLDGTKGLEAQTLSNYYKAIDANHFIIPIINKIDLPNADINQCLEDISDLGLDLDMVQYISAKTGEGVEKLLDNIIKFSPKAPSDITKPLKALVVDSWYDKYFGVVTLIRIFEGKIRQGDVIRLYSNNKILNVLSLGIFTPVKKPVEELLAGQIGYVITQVKNTSEFFVGDTITSEKAKVEPLEGFKKPNNVVFCTFYPEDVTQCNNIVEALKKYQLNDSAFDFSIETSDLYGMAFHCGFLGLLHMEIVKERLEREFEVFLITSLPCVSYKVEYRSNSGVKTEIIRNVEKWPENIINEEEPEVSVSIMVDTDCVGKVTNLCVGRRSVDLSIDAKTSNSKRNTVNCKMPLSEIIVDFDDKLKSMTRGFYSFEYEIVGYRQTKLSRLLVLINDEVIKEFGLICHVDRSKHIANSLCTKLKNLIPRCQYKIKIQIAKDTEKNIIAREDISPYRKDVIAKCYGGDITRKKKLLEKQKKGKDKRSEHHSVISTIPNNVLKQLLTFD